MTLAGLLLPVAAGALVVLILTTLFAFVRRCRLNVPPNRVAVIFGRRHQLTTGTDRVSVGYRLVRGGGAFIIPIFESKGELDLSTINIPDLVVRDGITKEGAPLTVKAVANIKIGSEDALLVNAVERLMGKPQEEIRKLAYETLEGHLRSILGTMTIEAVNNDRQAFQTRMITESQEDLARLGLRIDVLTVKELSDSTGYLESLGKTRVAQVKRDADIGAAEAMKQSTIQATTAHREGQVQEQDNLAQEAEAQKIKNVKIQKYLAEQNAEAARAAQAGPLATAVARREVVEREQEVILAQTQKATDVARAEQERKQQELMATEVRPAEAKKAAAIAEAEGLAEAIRIRATAEKERLIAEGQGRAEATRLELIAEADGTQAKLLAEATGILKKAEAYKLLDEAGRLLQILEAAQTLGPNMMKEFAHVMGEAAKPLAEVDKIVLIDGGGSGGNGHDRGAVERYGSAVPGLIFGFLERANAMGIDLTGLLGKAGVKANGDVPTTTKPADPKPADARRP